MAQKNTVGFHWMKRSSRSHSVTAPNTSTSTVLIASSGVILPVRMRLTTSSSTMATIRTAVAV